MAIHEQLPRQTHRDLRQVGWTKAAELAKVARRDGQSFDCATWLHKAQELPKEEFKREVERHLTGQDDRALGDALFQGLQKPAAGNREGARDRLLDARLSKVPRVLPGDDLCRLSGGCKSG